MYTQRTNPLPLTAAQLAALTRAAVRQLTWGQRIISHEAATWRARAALIPDRPLRDAAMHALNTKRGHMDGAGLFATLLPRRDRNLVRVLVAFELIWDYLDSVHEPVPTAANGRQLHLALRDALDPGAPPRDWYRHHSCSDDGGFLAALVRTCQHTAASLPSFPLVRSALACETRRAQVLALNHLTDPAERDHALQAWVASEFPGEAELEWYELSGAASASLVVHALLAVAADPDATPADAAAAYACYWPWTSLATTMLDSYADRAEDAANANHSYIAHYPSASAARRRVAAAITNSAAATKRMPNGEEHAVILAGMIALYLSKDSARAEPQTTRALARAGGTLSQVLVPVLRLWRRRYRQSAA